MEVEGLRANARKWVQIQLARLSGFFERLAGHVEIINRRVGKTKLWCPSCATQTIYDSWDRWGDHKWCCTQGCGGEYFRVCKDKEEAERAARYQRSVYPGGRYE